MPCILLVSTAISFSHSHSCQTLDRVATSFETYRLYHNCPTFEVLAPASQGVAYNNSNDCVICYTVLTNVNLGAALDSGRFPLLDAILNLMFTSGSRCRARRNACSLSPMLRVVREWLVGVLYVRPTSW